MHTPRISIRYNVDASYPGRTYFTVRDWTGVHKYRTNGNREGLWVVMDHGYFQCRGTGQFSLTGNYAVDYKRIHREFFSKDDLLMEEADLISDDF